MKKIILLILILLLLVICAWIFLLPYCSEETETWKTQQSCKECDVLQDMKRQRFIGTVNIQANGKMIFVEQKTKKQYTLVPCDRKCTNWLAQWFSNIEKDQKYNNKNFYDVEGTVDERTHELLILDAILL